jgi:Ser/Thr protein kinase RdoA (MazF antagonist)
VGRPVDGILQWVNPIFSPEVNLDIDLLTRRLMEQGLQTPTVVPTASGKLWLAGRAVQARAGCWRLLSFIPGSTLHAISSVEQARHAGRLVGRFHAALHGWEAPRHAPVRRIHDTEARIAELREAVAAHPTHPLFPEVAAVASEILSGWESWSGVVGLPDRICHGDLKISNIRFDASGREAVCLIDLDTVGPMELACELGDMWRSWCNPAGESDPDAVRFDVDIFRASADGFLSAAPPLSSAERSALVTATPRICLELAARFASDALRNSYFREDRDQFPVQGAHNLHRARAQFQLADCATEAIPECARALGVRI